MRFVVIRRKPDGSTVLLSFQLLDFCDANRVRRLLQGGYKEEHFEVVTATRSDRKKIEQASHFLAQPPHVIAEKLQAKLRKGGQ